VTCEEARVGKLFAELHDDLRAFIARQHVFFVTTAPLSADGHVNVSPKGLDTFRVLGPRTVAYGVPLYEFAADRLQLPEWCERKGAEGLREYQARKNRTSTDGLPGLRSADGGCR
jgi:hypothetical protein